MSFGKTGLSDDEQNKLEEVYLAHSDLTTEEFWQKVEEKLEGDSVKEKREN